MKHIITNNSNLKTEDAFQCALLALRTHESKPSLTVIEGTYIYDANHKTAGNIQLNVKQNKESITITIYNQT